MGKFRIEVMPEAKTDISKHLKSGNQSSIKKIAKILEELSETPFEGVGNPEPLAAEAFDNSNQMLMKGKGTADLFLNISSNYLFCGFDILPDYYCFDIFKSAQIEEDLENYPLHLSDALTF